jgi:tetratricopeptide (TPR) repeat protein
VSEEESPQYREALERFEDAERIFEQGDYRGALAEFQRIYDLLEGHPNRYFVLYNLGRAYEELHRYDRAIEMYRRYLAEGGAEADGRADVEASLRALERLLGTVEIAIVGPERAEVWLGEWQVGEAPGTISIPGGQHVIEIRAEGFEPQRREIEVAARQEVRIEVTLSQLSDFRGITPAVFATTSALAVASLGVAIGFGAHSLALHQDAESCVTRMSCVLDPQARQREIRDAALVADVSYGIAGVFAVTSVVLVFLTDWEGEPAPSDEPSVAVLPGIGRDFGGVQVLGRF